MKRLLCLFLLCSILISFDKSAPKVLLFIKEGSSQLEYMLTNEVGKMTEILKQSGFEVTIATVSGKVLSVGSVTVKPDLKLSEVNIDNYAGFIFPCMVLDLASPEMITLVRTAAAKGKPIAAQAGSVTLLAKAGILNGKKYATNIDTSTWPDFKNSIYSGRGVVQDGNIITSGVCPWIAKDTGYQDGTAKLTQTLIDAINGKAPSTIDVNQKSEAQVKTDTIKATLIKAQNLFKEGKAEEASKIYTSLMESHPDNREAVQGWIIANMKRTPTGEEEMIKSLEELGKKYPTNTGIIFFKAFIEGEYGHNEEALIDIDRLIKIQPDTALNYIAKGQTLYSMEKYEESFNSFDKATSLDPKRPDVWGMKAGALAKMGKFDEAIVSVTKGLELAPDDPTGIYNRACIYSLKGDKANALADLKKAVSMNPSFKEYARKDEDFKSLWDDEDFKKLTL
jgi:tetratricopeptide (TPR) repeat protein/putative intracellular protease/amidase